MFKKVVIVSLLLLAIFSIGAVSAAENISDTNIDAAEINEKLTVENDVESVEEVEDDLLSSASEDEKLEAQDDSVLGLSSIGNYITVYEDIEIGDYGYSNRIVYIGGINYYASGTLSIDIDNETFYTSQIIRYQSLYTEDFLKVPSYGLRNLTIKYSGDDYYDPFEKTYSVNFTYAFDVYYNDYYYGSEFRVILPEDAKNDVNVTVNDKNLGNISLNSYNRFTLDYDSLNLGYNYMTVTYADSKYPKRTVSTMFYVRPTFIIPSRYIIDDEKAIVTVNIPRHENGILILTKVQEPQEYPVPEYPVPESYVPEVHVQMYSDSESSRQFIKSVEVVNGTASIEIPKSNESTRYHVEFIGNERDEMYFYVDFIPSSPSIKIEYPTEVNEGDNIKILMENQGNQELNFNIFIDGEVVLHSHYLLNNLSISIPKLNVGTHEVMIRSFDPYYDYEDHVHFFKKFNITVNEKSVDVVNSTGSSDVNSGNTDSGKTNNVVTPSKTQKVEDKIALSLKSVKVKRSAKKLVISATLKINGKLAKYKYVRFKFNGKTYKIKTNSKGVAKLTIKKSTLKKLKVGKKVKYQVSYGKKTIKKSAKIRR